MKGATATLVAAAVLALAAPALARPVLVGSKKFTESVILGELITQAARDAHIEAEHRAELASTRVAWEALLRGDIDVYPDYTGTVAEELLGGVVDDDSLRTALRLRKVEMSGSLGFDDTYALGMLESRADALTVRDISDLRGHPSLRIGLSDEFYRRRDGWPGLQARYSLPQAEVRPLDHDVAYRAVQSGVVDVIDLYSTDAEIRSLGLRVLRDDQKYFPPYRAVLLYRADLGSRFPAMVELIRRLQGRISTDAMIRMNARARVDRLAEAAVAAEFLGHAAAVPTRGSRLLATTLEHLRLVGASLLVAILLGVPLGVVVHRHARLGRPLLALIGIVQTIPSLALLVSLIPLLGIGPLPALVALLLYSLLPIVRNTHAGLRAIPTALIESADVIGLSRGERLRLVELPLAAGSILAGIKTAAVINVGTATLGALVGAGGYGQPILAGIRLQDWGLLLEGAVPAAVLALVVEAMFTFIERRVVPPA
jgi:osmoprotectant transport system permease protein